MTKLDVVRGWKDEDYRSSLSEAERRMLPGNPAGLIEISDSELGAVGGGEAAGPYPGLYSCFGNCPSQFLQVCSADLGACGGSLFLDIRPGVPRKTPVS